MLSKKLFLILLIALFSFYGGTTFAQTNLKKENKAILKKEKPVIISKPYHDSQVSSVTIDDEKVNLEENPNQIYAAPEIRAEYPGGSQAFTKYIFSKYKSPTEEKINTKAFVSFVIEKDGTLSDIKVLRDPGYGIGKEILRIVKTSPKWKPAINSGKVVRSQYTFPISFMVN